MKSIMQKKEDGYCYLCALLHQDYQRRNNLEEHHVFMGPNRQASEHYGLKVYLCHEHHLDNPEAVHVNYKICRILQIAAQTAFMKQYPDKDFMKIFGKNYL